MLYKRLLLKISGEALKGNNDNDNYDLNIIKNIATQIIKLKKQKIEIAIVIGGGNIWRGNRAQDLELDKVTADYIGMLSTVMNSIVLARILNNLCSDSAYIQSKLEIPSVVDCFNHEKAKSLLNNGKIVILAGGTGSPYFTTDTAAVLKAIEVEADIILMAKNGIDGVYDSDPKQNKDAKFFSKITYNDLFTKKLNVIDQTAAILAQEAKIKTLIFDINENNSIYNIVNGTIKHTIIYK